MFKAYLSSLLFISVGRLLTKYKLFDIHKFMWLHTYIFENKAIFITQL